VQPYIRQLVKKHFYDNGFITTVPTEEGGKVLEILHPSYRVKRINKMKLSQLLLNNVERSTESGRSGDLFLDILQNEQKGLIKVEINLEEQDRNFLTNTYLDRLISDKESAEYHDYGEAVVKMLIEELLIPELTKEIRTELTDISENYVIQQCKDAYHNLLMTGPFLRDTE